MCLGERLSKEDVKRIVGQNPADEEMKGETEKNQRGRQRIRSDTVKSKGEKL